MPWSKSLGGGRFPSMNPYYMQQVEKLLRSRRVKMSTPIEKMPRRPRRRRSSTARTQKQRFTYESRSGHSWSYEAQFEGVVNNLQRRYDETSSDLVKEDIEKFMSANDVQDVQGRAAQARSAGRHGRRTRTSTRADRDVGRARERVLPRLRADASAKS